MRIYAFKVFSGKIKSDQKLFEEDALPLVEAEKK
jgi:hypothetical protein